MRPAISAQPFLAWLESGVRWLLDEVLTTANIVYTAMEIPAVVATGFAAWWVHDFVHPLLQERIGRSSANAFSRTMLLKLASLVFPLLWAAGLGLAMGVAAKFGWPYNVVRIAINLLAAWTAISLFSSAVRNPLWSRAVMLSAYTIAVLNIVHLLTPTVELLDSASVTYGNIRISLLTVLRGMLSLAVLLWVAMLLSGMLERRIQKLPNFTPSVQVLIGKLFKASVVTIAIIVSLAGVGIDLTAVAVFSGAVGVGIGFGLQKVVSNLISGIIVLMDRSIKPGDVIQVGDTYGWVSSLGARYVSIHTRDGTEFLIPNEDIVTKQVTNWTHEDDLVRLKAKVPVSFRADVPGALKLMTAAAANSSRVLREPKPTALMLGFGEHVIHLELRFWIRDAHNGIRNVTSEVLLEILRLFKEHGIEIPLPERNVHVLGPAADERPTLGAPVPT